MNTSFERTNKNDEWLTPPELIKTLGSFDLDPCAPIIRPWDTALKHYTKEDNGLLQDWQGRVWCNPPYGNQLPFWLNKCVLHGNCIVLTFARTDTRMFFEYVWNAAGAVFFIKGRIKFYYVDGHNIYNAGAPSVLIAYGKNNVSALQNCNLKGKFINLFQNE
jgi:hypothetical protein